MTPGPGYQDWPDDLFNQGGEVSQDRDMCANCGNWRELHYAGESGIYIGDKVLGCYEYQGSAVPEERRKNKAKEIDDARARFRDGLREEQGAPPKRR